MHILLSVILIFKLLSKRDFELGYHIHQHYSITRIDIYDELHFLRNLQRFALIFANIKEFIFTVSVIFSLRNSGPQKKRKKNTDNNCYKQTTITVNCRYHFNNRGGCRFSIAFVINNNNTNSFIQRN